jgi:RimJ/RimL family protein N-acetyltransferase
MGFPKVDLSTPRLRLRPWRRSDIEDAYTYASDPEWGRYLWNTPFPYTREHAEAFVSRAALSDWSTEALWAIEVDAHVVGAPDST